MPDAAVSSPPQGLSQKVVAGAGWSSMSSVARQILSLVCVGFLARRLGPGSYGLMAMANVLMVFLLNFRDLGTVTAIIQKTEVSNRLLSSLFWTNCAFGLALTLFVFGSAGPAGRFFQEPRLPAIVRALSVSFLITAAGSVHNALLTRSMSFRHIAYIDLMSSVAGYVIAITGALSGIGVWSLVFANLANAIVTTLGYWWFGRWTPRLEVDRREIRSIARFSLNLSGFGLVNYFNRNADNIVVGRILGAEPLGFYQMAYNLMLYPIQNISSVLGQVLLPAFSKIQSDDDRFRSAYIRSSMLIGLITFPLLMGMAVLADPLVRAVLGDKWVAVIPLFRILAPVGIIQSVQGSIGQIYVAKGRTDLMFRWGMGAAVVLLTGFMLGVRFGVRGVAVAYAVSYIGVLMYPGFAIPFRLIGLSFSFFARCFWPQLAISLAMTAICAGWINSLAAMSYSNPWGILISTSLIGAFVYIALMVKIRPSVVLHMEQAVGSLPDSLAGRCLRAIGLFPAD